MDGFFNSYIVGWEKNSSKHVWSQMFSLLFNVKLTWAWNFLKWLKVETITSNRILGILLVCILNTTWSSSWETSIVAFYFQMLICNVFSAISVSGALCEQAVVGITLFLHCIYVFSWLILQIETGGNPGILFKTHPNMNKELFSNENILGLKDPNRPFPTGQSGDAGGVGLLKWRMQTTDESIVPLTSGFKSYTFHLLCVLFVLYALNVYMNRCMLQSTAGPLFLEMKLMSALNMKLHQCLICETLWSRYLFQLFERHLMSDRLMVNGGEKFNFFFNRLYFSL